MNKEPVLVIMAAGIGSRYGGGIKQLARIGTCGEILMDYSISDAIEAGFRKVIFVIRKDLEKDFREIIGDRIARRVQVYYAFQETNDLPEGFSCPETRTKPWGTGHAILACRDLIDAPFAVINADDYYGKKAFRLIYDFLAACREDAAPMQMAMAGFILKNTLSDNGTVTRGVCATDGNGHLAKVRETFEIRRHEDGVVRGTVDGITAELDPECFVSMNLWGFPAGFMEELKKGFPAFLTKALEENPLKAEYLLPVIVDDMLQSGRAVIDILPTPDTWFGITYREDKAYVEEQFRKMIRDGLYTEPLFS